MNEKKRIMLLLVVVVVVYASIRRRLAMDNELYLFHKPTVTDLSFPKVYFRTTDPTTFFDRSPSAA